jgi:hypothetical protein
MPTKAELENQIESLEQDLRRVKRALGQAELDLDITHIEIKDHITPAASDQMKDVLSRANVEWDRVVKDPSQRIDAYIKSSAGLGWSWEKAYVQNGQFAWCGAFAAFCYTKANFNIRKKIFPSCYRLYSNWGQTSRKIATDKIQRGDIVVVWSGKNSVQGDHITICSNADTLKSGYISTIEGNAVGTLGDETRGEGVIKRQRSVDEIAHVYRLLASDYDE